MTNVILRRLSASILRLWLTLLATVGVMLSQAQTAADAGKDSTDVFFGHLKLNEIVVVSATGETLLRESTTPVTVLGANELNRRASTNIIDAIAKLPGVSQITTGGGISKPVIRGLGYNRVLTVVDGIRQEGQQWGDEHGIEVDEATVTSVEVLKGPASLVYGSDALAGVVRLNTAPHVPLGQQHASIATQWQSNPDLLGYTANWAGNLGGNIWDLRYSGKFAHSYKNARDGYVPGTQFSEQAFRALGGLNRRWGHSHLVFSYYHLTPTIAEGERDPMTGCLVLPDGDVKTYAHGMPYQQVRHYKVVTDNRIVLGGGRLNAIMGYQQNQRKEFEEDPDSYDLYLKLHTFTANVFYSKRHDEWRWTAGMNSMYQKSVNDGEEYLIPDHHLVDAGVFGTVNWTAGERWNVSAGLRYDHRHLVSHSLMDDDELRFEAFKRNMGSVSASIGAVWHAHRQIDVRLNMARGFRAPNISELASNGAHEGTFRYEVGDNSLSPEHSLQFDLGMDFNNNVLTAGLSLFANLIDNYIYLEHRSGATIDGMDVYDYRAGDARLLGGELTIDFHPIHALHLGTSAGMVNAVLLHQPAMSHYLPMVPAAQWNFDVKYEITHDRHTFSNCYVALSLANTFSQSHCYLAGGTEWPTPAYSLLGFQAGTDIMYRGRRVATLTVIGDNLTDKAYQSHLSRFKLAPENPVTHERGICNMGRNFTVKLEIPLVW